MDRPGATTDSWTATIEKGGLWIGHGARVVWCIDPLARIVVEMRPGDEPREPFVEDVADAAPVLDMHVAVADLFVGLG